ncbi:MAG: lysophospholipid acyltransferase family protein [Candidatus Dormibacteraceae bacterium]
MLRSSYFAASRLSLAVPASVGNAVARAGGSLWYRGSPGQRRAAHDNYAVVLGRSPDDPEVRRVARRAFQNYGIMIADFLRMGTLTPETVIGRVGHDGREHVDRALERGRGCVLALAHMGAWDMAAAVAASFDYKLLAVAERFPGSLNEAVVGARERFGVHITMVNRRTISEIRAALARNELVALLCDLPQGPGGAAVSFFGQAARVPAGPAAFMLKDGAGLVPVRINRIGEERYHVHVDPEIAYTATGDRRHDTQAIMQSVVSRFERFISQQPDQWYAFRPLFTPA